MRNACSSCVCEEEVLQVVPLLCTLIMVSFYCFFLGCCCCTVQLIFRGEKNANVGVMSFVQMQCVRTYDAKLTSESFREFKHIIVRFGCSMVPGTRYNTVHRTVL